MDKLWDKGFDEDARIDSFTVGNDRELDLLLAPYDILGTIAHIKMLAKVGLLPGEDLAKLLPELRNMYSAAVEGRFVIEPDVEDVHSQVELNLTRKLGDMGKKVHVTLIYKWQCLPLSDSGSEPTPRASRTIW